MPPTPTCGASPAIFGTAGGTSAPVSICSTSGAAYTRPGAWPDADMLPLGRIGIRAERGNDRTTRFTRDEQRTLMSLWSIARSPLMFGGDLPSNDDFTLSLLTNDEVLNVDQNSRHSRQLFQRGDQIAWISDAAGVSCGLQCGRTSAPGDSRELGRAGFAGNLHSARSLGEEIPGAGEGRLYVQDPAARFGPIPGFRTATVRERPPAPRCRQEESKRWFPVAAAARRPPESACRCAGGPPRIR